ncbi:MAG: hypothetical protein H0U46_09860 [Actinobacteria bacterium]|nr:hypothetical protein [Actinomycetota bacterium]
MGGFSAGAGLALWLGLTNGDLFRGVIALSGVVRFLGSAGVTRGSFSPTAFETA